MYVLPSLFTAGNVALGFYSITQGVDGTFGRRLSLQPGGAGDRVCSGDGRAGWVGGAAYEDDERFWQGAGLACGRADIWVGAGAAGVYLGLQDALAGLPSSGAGAGVAAGCSGLFCVFDLRGMPVGAVQHCGEPAAEESGAAGEQVFRRDADSGGRGRDCFGDSLSGGEPDSRSSDFDCVAAADSGGGLFDGEFVAVLEWEGSDFGAAAADSDAGA